MYYQRKICNVYHTIIEDLSASHIFFHIIYIYIYTYTYIYIFIRLLAIEQVNMNSWFLYQCIHGFYQYVPIYNHIFPLCFPYFPIFFPYVSYICLIFFPYSPTFPIFFSMFPLCFPLRLLNMTYSHGRSGPEPRDHQASGVSVPAPAK